MLVLVDTPIWSLALRRKVADLNPREQRLTLALRELIREGRARIIGPVRQELLSGIRLEGIFKALRDHLRAFDEPFLEVDDFETAAQIHNQCRAKGIAGSPIDFLVCAAAQRRNWQIFTADNDFIHFGKATGIHLYQLS